jgi:hypothetical protein
MIAPSVGGHHDQPFAIFEVDKGAGMRFTASSPCGCQEQGPASDDPRTDESSRVTVDKLMGLEVRKLERSCGGVAHGSHSLCRCRRLPFRGPWRRTIDAPCSARMSLHSSEPISPPGGPGDGGCQSGCGRQSPGPHRPPPRRSGHHHLPLGRAGSGSTHAEHERRYAEYEGRCTAHRPSTRPRPRRRTRQCQPLRARGPPQGRSAAGTAS